MMASELLLLKDGCDLPIAGRLSPVGFARDVKGRIAGRGDEELAGTNRPDLLREALREEDERLDRLRPDGLEVDLEHGCEEKSNQRTGLAEPTNKNELACQVPQDNIKRWLDIFSISSQLPICNDPKLTNLHTLLPRPLHRKRHLLDLNGLGDEVRRDRRTRRGEEDSGDLERRQSKERILRKEVGEKSVVDSSLTVLRAVGGDLDELKSGDPLHHTPMPGEPFNHDDDVVG
jgi:hypothetical protein